MADEEQKIEREKLQYVKRIYTGNNQLYFGSRRIFEKAEVREVEMRGRVLFSAIEAKILPNKNQAMLNFIFNIKEINIMSPPLRYGYLSKTVKGYIDGLKNNPIMSNVRLCYVPLHSVLINYFIHYLENGFTPVIDIQTIQRMKLPIDGVHISLSYKLR
jgi:hypothetical protein